MALSSSAQLLPLAPMETSALRLTPSPPSGTLDREAILSLCKGIRCITHVDLDAFYCQVEHNRLTIPASVPLAVQQWNGLIAVNYAARAAGIQRHMNVQEALEKCPDLRLVHVATYDESNPEPQYHPNPHPRSHKVSLEPYRRASAKIFAIIARKAKNYERASIDEAYLDWTQDVVDRILAMDPLPESPSPAIVWDDATLGTLFDSDTRPLDQAHTTWADYMLWHAAQLTAELRRDILQELNLTCSAGIAHNKTIAKLCSSIHKPNKQTTMRTCSTLDFLAPLPISKIRSLGGKLGANVEAQMDVKTCAELRERSLADLQAQFDPAVAQWLYRICRGECDQPVAARSKAKSMLAAKRMRPYATGMHQLEHWVTILAGEIMTRVRDDLDVHSRWPKNLVVNVKPSAGDAKTKTVSFPSRHAIGDSPDALVAKAMTVISAVGSVLPCEYLSMQVNSFESIDTTDALAQWIRKGGSNPAVTDRLSSPPPMARSSSSSSAAPPPPHPVSFFEQQKRASSEGPFPLDPGGPSIPNSPPHIALPNAPLTHAPVQYQTRPPPAVRTSSSSSSTSVTPTLHRPGAFDLLEKDKAAREALKTQKAAGPRPKLIGPSTPAVGGFALLEKDRKVRRVTGKQTKMTSFTGKKTGPAATIANMLKKQDGKQKVGRDTFALVSSSDEELEGHVVQDDEDDIQEVVRACEPRMQVCPVCRDEYPTMLMQEHLAFHEREGHSVPTGQPSKRPISAVDGSPSHSDKQPRRPRTEHLQRDGGSAEECGECPMCGVMMGVSQLPQHASACCGVEQRSSKQDRGDMGFIDGEAEEEEDASDDVGVGLSTCRKCGEVFPTMCMEEHLDYHLAKELSET